MHIFCALYVLEIFCAPPACAGLYRCYFLSICPLLFSLANIHHMYNKAKITMKEKTNVRKKNSGCLFESINIWTPIKSSILRQLCVLVCLLSSCLAHCLHTAIQLPYSADNTHGPPCSRHIDGNCEMWSVRMERGGCRGWECQDWTPCSSQGG